MNHKANVIKIGEQYAVIKYLLPTKYYHETNIANESHRQLLVRGIHYVLFDAHEIVEDLQEFIQPHPMDGYEYPMDGHTFPNYGKFAPYPQQIYTSRFLYKNMNGVHLHSAMRCGKSLSCLWVMDFCIKSGIFSKVLICAPKTLMMSTWAKELSHHFMHLDYTIKRGVARDKPTNTVIDIVNHDGLTIMINKGNVQKYDLIIYDESTAVKTASSARFKTLEKYKKKTNCKLWLLTGTPLAQSPLAAYGNARLVNPNLVPTSFTAWRNLTCYNSWGFEWLPRNEAPIICANALQPSVRFELRDIIEIEDHTYDFVECAKSVKQAKMFKQMAQEFAAEYDAGENTINAVNAAAKTSKLLQILSGVVYDENRNHIFTDAEPRLEALCDLIDQLPEDQPIVVFAEWTHTQQMLKDYLKPKYGSVELMNGDTPTHDKEGGRLFLEREFLAKKIKVLIPHPVVCSMGLNLSSTNVIAWFTPTFRAELFQQGNERVRNFNSSAQGYDKFLIYQFVSDPLERKYFESLRDKDLTQREFFKLVRTSIQDEFGI